MDTVTLASRPTPSAAPARWPDQVSVDPVTIVEVRDENDVITARLKVTQAIFSVGRGPENDVIVEDDYVDPVHLRVSVDQDSPTVMVQDTGSENGTKISGGLLRGSEAVVPLGERVVLGRTTLVFTSPSQLVAAAKSLGESSPRLLAYEKLPAWKSLFFASFLVATETYLSSYMPKNAAGFLGAGMGTATGLLAWAGLWALGGRIFARAARFRQHLAFASLTMLIAVPIGASLGWLAYVLGSPTLQMICDWVILGFALWGASLLGHVDIASNKSRVFKLSLVGGITAAVLTVAMATDQLALSPVEEITNSLQRIYPAPADVTRSQSLQAFLEAAGALER